MAYVYGIHAVDSLLRRDPESVTGLHVQKGSPDQRRQALLALAKDCGVTVHVHPRSVLDAMVEARHQGVIAETSATYSAPSEIAWREKDLLAHIDNSATPVLLLILDGVTDPHNLGACLRSADAAGVDAVIAPKDRSAGLTPVVRKVACGAAETVPFVQVTNLSRTLAACKARGVWLYGACGEADTALFDHELTASAGLVLGAEGSGLRRLTREACDVLVHLPMAGSVSSLNVSVAAGVCLFEVVRQRRAAR